MAKVARTDIWKSESLRLLSRRLCFGAKAFGAGTVGRGSSSAPVTVELQDSVQTETTSLSPVEDVEETDDVLLRG